MPRNIILIDKRVQDYETILAAVDTNVCIPVLFNYYTDTIEEIKARITEAVAEAESVIGDIPSSLVSSPVSSPVSSRCIGLLQHNYNLPFYHFVADNAQGGIITNVSNYDPELATWSPLRDLITWSRTTPEINAVYFDMMACALYANKDWKYIIDTLATQTGITIRASTDDTGSSALGGDWFLESHTGVNLKTLYFTEAIENYQGILLSLTIYPYYNSKYNFKGFATGSLVAWGETKFGGNLSSYNPTTNIFTSVASSLTSEVVSVYSTIYAFAALKTNGSVVVWGDSQNGGIASSYNPTGGIYTSVASSLTSGVVSICSNNYAFAALKTNGSVVAWGYSQYGGVTSSFNPSDSIYTSVASSLTSGVVSIYSNKYAFAALKTDGSVVTWGHSQYGGVTSTFNSTSGIYTSVASSLTSGVVTIYSTIGAFAALKTDGSVVSWGDSQYGGILSSYNPTGNIYSSVASSLTSGVESIYSNNNAFAALKTDGSVVNWGNTVVGGNSAIYNPTINSYTSVASSLTSGVVSICSHNNAFAALKTNGGVVTWGISTLGGTTSSYNAANYSYTSVASSLTSGVVSIISNYIYAFAALKSDGSVVVWGDSQNGGTASIYNPNGSTYTSVASSLTSGVVSIYSTGRAFAALKSDGSVVTWGHSQYGGNTPNLTSGVVAIYSNELAFSALKNDGSVVAWGFPPGGGVTSSYNSNNDTYTSVSSSLTSGVIALSPNNLAFTALKTTATTFDLSSSIYTDMDRYDILRNKESRRRVNLTTLNNNVFTLSQARDIQVINPTIPSADIALRIIVPNYVSSSYSIASTVTIPSGTSSSYIIACEKGELVTIGTTTYVNYGRNVYRREINNTYTKLTIETIGGITYDIFGADSNYSSGIALVLLYPSPTLSNFPNITKVTSTPPFQLTPPTSNSTGTFSYTSSNTSVATIAGDIVTIVGFGTSTITATQASDNANYGNGRITATLTTTAANYYGADLSGSNFTNVSLYGANLNLTNLTNAIFVSTDLSGATLLGATLTNILSRNVVGLATATLPTTGGGYVARSGSILGNNVRITSANLTNADLSGITLTNSDVSGATFVGATLTNIRTAGLSGTATATLPAGYVFRNGVIVGPNVSLVSSALTSADLSGVSIAGTDLSGTDLSGANLTNLVSGNLRNASLAPAGTTILPTGYIFYNNFIVGPAVNLTSAALSGLDLSGAANLTAAKLVSANLTGASLFNIDISGADLSGATLTNVRSFGLTGGTAASPATRLPTGYFVRAPGTIVGPAVNLSSLSLQNIDLSGGITLTGSNLTNTDLSGASTNLVGVITGSLVGADTATLPVGYVARNGFIVGPRVILRGANLSGMNLTGIDLSGVDLSGANLSNSILTNVNIHPTTTNLTNTILTGVVSGGITGASVATPSTTLPASYRIRSGFIVGPAVNLTNAAATSIDLSNVALTGANFTGATLTGANLTSATLTGATLTGANLTSAVLTNVTTGSLIGATTATLPTGYIVRGTSTPGTFIVGPSVILRGANLTNADLTNLSIASCDVSGVTFTGATVTGLISGGLINAANIAALPSASYVIRNNFIVGPGVNLSGATLTSQLFTGLSVAGANFTNANLTGATFTTTTVTNANFTGATFTNIVCGGGLIGVASATLPSAAYIARTATYNVFLGPYVITRNLNFTNIDLASVSLVGADLSGCNLTNAVLTNADISGVNLRGTTLSGVITGGLVSSSSTIPPTGYIIRAGFIVGPSVNLVGANLSNQDISGQSLVGANITGANFLGATFTRLVSGATTGADTASLPNGYVARNGYILGPYVFLRGITTGLTNINLSGVPLTGADLSGCVFTNSDFTNVDISAANLSRVTFTGVISGGVTGGASTSLIMPTGFVVRGGYILGAGVNLISANLSGSLDLTDVILTGANISGANFTGANLTRLVTGTLVNNATAPSLATLPTGYVFRSGFIIGPNVSLASAIITNVDLSGVSLVGTNMTSANISGASTILTRVTSGGITGLATATLPTGYVARNGYIIGAGVSASGAALASMNFTSVNMTDIDLSGATLTGATLTSATLTGANLTNAILTNAVTGGGIIGLVGVSNPATLPAGYVARSIGGTTTNGFIIGPRVSLQNATLTGGVDLSGVALTSVNFTGANLTGAILTNTDISGAIFTNTTLTSVRSGGLTGAATATLRTGYVVRYTGGGGAGTGSGFLIGAGVSLAGADLSAVDMTGVVLTSTVFTGANLTNANLRNATLTTANLSGATVTGLLTGSIVGLTTATLPSASYAARGGGGSVGWIVGPGVRLVGANLSSTDLTDLSITGCDISGANFSGATITRLRTGGLVYGGASAATANITLPNASTSMRGASGAGYLVGPLVSLADANFNGIDLSGATFTGADIRGAIFTTTTNLTNITTGELRNANLATFPATPPQSTAYFVRNGFIVGPGVRLLSADLSGITLTGYSIARTNLTGANLTNAVFTGADISGANFTSATLTGVNSTGGGITGGNPATDGTVFPTISAGSGAGIWGVRAGFLLGPTAIARSATLGAGGIDLSGINLRACDLSGANFTGASFTNNDITATNFTNAIFTGVTSQGLVTATTAGSSQPVFAGASASYALRGGFIVGPAVALAGKNLTGVNLASLALTSANFTNANLTNAVLTAADISGATFAGATFAGIRSGQIVSPNQGAAAAVTLPTNFQLRGGFILGPGCNLSGDDLTNVDASGTNLANAVITSATNFTNALIVGATLTGLTFTTVQKSQLRRNVANVTAEIAALTITTVIPSDLPLMNPTIRTTDIIRLTGGIDVYTPVIGGGGGGATIVNDFVSDANQSKGVYVNIPNNTPFQIRGDYEGDNVQYTSTTAGTIVDASQNPVTIIRIRNTVYRVFAGSLIGIPVTLNEYQLRGIAGLYDVLMEDGGYGSAPRGSTGPQGAPGTNAINGATGITGPAALTNGATGPQGIIGHTGLNGDTGPTGIIGATGPIGATGTTGVYGPKGPPGIAASVGDTGPIGEDGPSGGTTGPRGIPGPVDYVGATGPSPSMEYAPTGPNGTFETIGATGAIGMTGPTGEYAVWNAVTAPGGTGIYYNGRVAIGKSAPPDAAFALDVSGSIRCIGINNVSDYRIKENVRDIGAIGESTSLMNLHGAHYWNTLTNQYEYGFIAHQVQEIYPQLVDGEKDAVNELQSVDYRSMFAILARDIQLLKERIEKTTVKQ